MPIKVTCKCGQSFAAKDQLAGKVVKCPKCAQPLRIPQPKQKPPAPQQPPAPAAGGLSDLFDEAGMTGHAQDDYKGARCPSCNAPLAHNATLCVECGLNLQTGKYVKGIGQASQRGPKKAEGYEGAAQQLLAKAERALDAAPMAADRGEKEAWYLPWVTAIALIAVGAVAFVLWMGFSRLINMPEEEAADQASRLGKGVVFWVGLSMASLGGLLMLTSELRIAVYAFKFQDTLHGILSLLIRPYAVIYAVLQRGNLDYWVKVWGAGLFLSVGGLFVFCYQAFLSQMDFSPSSLVQVIMGIVILVAAAAGMLLLFAGWITSMVIGFMDRVYHGVLAIIFPVYGASYCIIRKGDNPVPAKLWLYGIFLIVGDFLFLLIMGAINAAKSGDVGVGALLVILMWIIVRLVVIPMCTTQVFAGLIAGAIAMYNAMFAKKKKERVDLGGYGEVSYMGFILMLTSYVGVFTPLMALGIALVALSGMIGGAVGAVLGVFSLLLVVQLTPMVFVLADMTSYLGDAPFQRGLVVSVIFLILWFILLVILFVIFAVFFGLMGMLESMF